MKIQPQVYPFHGQRDAISPVPFSGINASSLRLLSIQPVVSSLVAQGASNA